MLGGGNPVGSSNPAGVGSSINYVGKHAYAYSGPINIDQTSDGITMLQFSSGNQYILGTTIMGRNDFSGDDIVYRIEFDGQLVGVFGTSNYNLGTTNTNIDILIPPNTNVRISARNISADTDRECFALLTGEVYA